MDSKTKSLYGIAKPKYKNDWNCRSGVSSAMYIGHNNISQQYRLLVSV
jgi:hypothetical protein